MLADAEAFRRAGDFSAAQSTLRSALDIASKENGRDLRLAVTDEEEAERNLQDTIREAHGLVENEGPPDAPHVPFALQNDEQHSVLPPHLFPLVLHVALSATHLPPSQTVQSGHLVPQPPQLARSVTVLVHADPLVVGQDCCPVGHWHLPPAQTSSGWSKPASRQSRAQATTPPIEMASNPRLSAQWFSRSAARWSKIPQSGPMVW